MIEEQLVNIALNEEFPELDKMFHELKARNLRLWMELRRMDQKSVAFLESFKEGAVDEQPLLKALETSKTTSMQYKVIRALPFKNAGGKVRFFFSPLPLQNLISGAPLPLI